MLIRLVLRVDVLTANQWLLLGTAWAGIIYYVIICLLLIHGGFVTEKWNWSICKWHSIWGILAWWCRMIVVKLRRLRYVHAVQEVFDFRFIQLFVSQQFSYVCCLADIPDPLRELNEDFLQLPMTPEAKGSPMGGGHWGGGGRKSIQLVGAVLENGLYNK